MMLTLILFGAVFSSIIWLVYAIQFITSSLSGMSFFDAGIVNVLLYSIFVCLPILIIWAVFGFVCQYIFNKVAAKQMFRLFSQMKKNQEYSDLLARIMLETEQNIKNSFVLGRFDLIVADMNELLSEFLKRERLASAEQIENLWIKVQNGGKWSFGKVVIENYNQQQDFQKKIFANAQEDNLLAGTIMEFCARYQTLLNLLEKHDKERILLGIVETGVFGKVFAILAPIADELHRTKEMFAPKEQKEIFQPKENNLVAGTNRPIMGENAATAETFAPNRTVKDEKSPNKITKFFEKFIPQKQDISLQPAPKDAFSLALERSFGKEPERVKEEPVFDDTQPNDLVITQDTKEENQPNSSLAEDGVALDTQKTLDTLKKEWQSINTNNIRNISSENKDEKITSPFSGWTDVENYQK